jgi:hypothetical protein
MSYRGQKFEVKTTRTLVDAFPKRNERVAIEISRPTGTVVMKITWSSSEPPKSVGVMVNNRPAGNLTPSLRTEHGRKSLVWPAPDPQVNDHYVIFWDWD